MFGRNNWGPIPSAICIAAVALLIAWVLLQRSRAGLYIFAIGGSRETARVSGIPDDRLGENSRRGSNRTVAERKIRQHTPGTDSGKNEVKKQCGIDLLRRHEQTG